MRSALGVLTLTPSDCWRRAHAVHHASAGNLDERGMGDIRTLTVARINRELSWRGRLAYRLYRHPLVMFGLGPISAVHLRAKDFQISMMRGGLTPWVVIHDHQSRHRGCGGHSHLGRRHPGAFLVVHLPIVILAGSAGILAVLRAAPVRGDGMGKG